MSVGTFYCWKICRYLLEDLIVTCAIIAFLSCLQSQVEAEIGGIFFTPASLSRTLS